MATSPGYDAFISYSHQHDRALGPALQTGLERFAKPWYRMRALRIFRDEANLSASPGLWAAIEDALQSSRWFILLASPDAAKSAWVNREVRWWLDHRPTDRLLVVGTGPGLAWDEQERDWVADAPVPPALRGAFASEPRWVELSDLRFHRQAPVIPADRLAEVAAPIRGLRKEMLIGEHLQKHRRAMRLAWGAVAFLLALAVGLALVAIVAIGARQQAIGERDVAVSGQLITQSEALRNADPPLSRLLSIAAWRINPSNAARYAMLTAARLPEIASLTGSAFPLESVAFSPDGKTLVGVNGAGEILLWNVATPHQFKGRLNSIYSPVNSVALGPGGKVLVAPSLRGGIRLWNMATHRQVASPFKSSTGGINSVALSPDSKILASVSNAGTVRLWNTATGRQIGSPLNGDTGPVNSVAFSPAGRTLASVTGNGTVGLWDVATGHRVRNYISGGAGSRGIVTFSPNGKTLASVAGNGTVGLWNVTSGELIPNDINAGQANSVAFSPDGSTVASANEDGTVRLWNVASGQQIGSSLNGDTGPVNSVAFSPDGSTVASANEDGTVRLWNVASLMETNTLTDTKIGNGRVESVAFSPDGRVLASANEHGTILWNMATRQPTGKPLVDSTGPVYSVAFSPDGKTLATATFYGTVLWNVATQRTIGNPLPGGCGSVEGMTFRLSGDVPGGHAASSWACW